MFKTLKKWFNRKPAPAPVRRARPRLEGLEERAVPAAYYWYGGNSSDWMGMGNWKDASGTPYMFPPSSNQHDVYFDGSKSNVDCTFSATPGSPICNNLYIQNGYRGTLTMNPSGSTSATITIDGDLVLSSTGAVVSGAQVDPELAIGAGDTVVANGTTTWSGSVKIDTSDANTQGTLRVSYANISGGDKLSGATIEVVGDDSYSSHINLDYDSGASAYYELILSKEAIIDVASGSEVVHSNGTISSNNNSTGSNNWVENHGLWQKDNATLSVITTQFVNYGTLEITDGTLNFNGANINSGETRSYIQDVSGTTNIHAGATLNSSNSNFTVWLDGYLTTTGTGTAYLYSTDTLYLNCFLDINGTGFGTLDCGADYVRLEEDFEYTCGVSRDTDACDVLTTTGVISVQTGAALDVNVYGTGTGLKVWNFMVAGTGTLNYIPFEFDAADSNADEQGISLYRSLANFLPDKYTLGKTY